VTTRKLPTSSIVLSSSGQPQLRFKACLASRPLTVFDRCFKSHPGLRLQDLTAHDIRHYVTSKLDLHEDRDRLISGPGNQFGPIDIIREVVRKPSGVFLWVTITVKSLEAGLDNGDDIFELKARLDETPADLQGLYLATLRNVEPRYRWQAADLLRIIKCARRPLTLLELAFASDGPTSAIAQNIRVRDDTKLLPKCRFMEKRLRSRCGALLDISEAPTHDQESNEGTDVAFDWIPPSLQDAGSTQAEYTGSEESETKSKIGSGQRLHDELPIGAVMRRTVKFLHLSVREFLDLPSSWQVLDADRTSTPDPYIYLISSHLCLLNLCNRSWLLHSHPESYFLSPCITREDPIIKIMHYGLMVREDSSGVLVALLDKMHATMTEYSTEYSSKNSEPWFIPLTDYDYSAGNQVPSPKWPKRWHSNFLAFAAYYGLIEYVKTKSK